MYEIKDLLKVKEYELMIQQKLANEVKKVYDFEDEHDGNGTHDCHLSPEDGCDCQKEEYACDNNPYGTTVELYDIDHENN